MKLEYKKKKKCNFQHIYVNLETKYCVKAYTFWLCYNGIRKYILILIYSNIKKLFICIFSNMTFEKLWNVLTSRIVPICSQKFH